LAKYSHNTPVKCHFSIKNKTKSIIVVEDLDRFFTEKSTAVSLFVDVHIYFFLCEFLAFKMLANSYLGLKDHELLSQVEDIFQSRGSMSPAEISKLMIVNRNSLNWAIKSVIMALQTDDDQRGVRKIGLRLENNTTPKHSGNNVTPNTHNFFKKIK